MKSPKDPTNPPSRKPRSAGQPADPPPPKAASPKSTGRKVAPPPRPQPPAGSSKSPPTVPARTAAPRKPTPAKVGKAGRASKATAATAPPSAAPTPKPASAKARAAKPGARREPTPTPPAPPREVTSRRPAVPPKPAPPLPPILFEGDDSPGSVPLGRGPRFPLGRPALEGAAFEADASAESAGLPTAYDTRRLTLVARDVEWLHAQWDFSGEQLDAYRSAGRGGMELRLFRPAAGGELVVTATVPWEARSWLLRARQAGARYVAELGYTDTEGRWLAIARSAPAVTPSLLAAEQTAADEFATIPVDVPFAEIFAKVKAVVEAARVQCDAELAPLMEVLVELRAAGFVDLPAAAAPAPGDWTPAQERALAAVTCMDAARHVWVGSIDVTELVRRGLAAGVSSLTAPGFSAPGKPPGPGPAELLPPGLSSAELGGAAPRRRGFWFNVNAEVVLYGATEPDATLTVAGQRIRLRPDGSFSLRFALPDGRYELGVEAESADGVEGRSARLEFGRHTEYRGDVGVHPQADHLRAPHRENIQ